MEILFDNPLANMYGPYFLLIYGFFIFFTLITLGIARVNLDRTDRLKLPSIPSVVDPYEIAYLRGGENELARAVTFALVQKEVLRLNEAGGYAKLEPAQSTRPASLSPIERTAMNWFTVERKPRELFGRGGLANELSGYSAEYKRRLESQQLLTPGAAIWRPATQLAAVLVLGLGGYKIAAAVANGHRNFIFTIVLMIIGVIGVALISSLPRLSKLGRSYVESLKMAFGNLPKTERPQIYGEQTTFASVDPILLSVGVFGTGALAGSMFDSYRRTFPQTDARAYDSGSGSGGCGSACDSSGGSSCGGGGGCGGGGCGGCGG